MGKSLENLEKIVRQKELSLADVKKRIEAATAPLLQQQKVLLEELETAKNNLSLARIVELGSWHPPTESRFWLKAISIGRDESYVDTLFRRDAFNRAGFTVNGMDNLHQAIVSVTNFENREMSTENLRSILEIGMTCFAKIYEQESEAEPVRFVLGHFEETDNDTDEKSYTEFALELNMLRKNVVARIDGKDSKTFSSGNFLSNAIEYILKERAKQLGIEYSKKPEEPQPEQVRNFVESFRKGM
jgi:hypothetical protein